MKGNFLMRPSVLIVDDEKIICNGIERVLSRDYITYQALNGKEAIEVIKKIGDIDVILCDLKMPVMDGIEMIEKIRATDKDVYIVVITAAPPQEVCKAMKMGANNFLSKPFDITQLQIIIRNAVEFKKNNTGSIVRNKYVEYQAVENS